MDCITTRIPYRQTNAFSNIVLDYIDHAAGMDSFFKYSPDLQGIKNAIAARKKYTTDRKLLTAELNKQYASVVKPGLVKENIDALVSENTFTVTTAHQPNIFTGPLFFIYKILHAVKLAEHLNKSLPENKFVPVYYMGSEDADLEELGHIYINGEKYIWNTKQTGAVGRMRVDMELIKLIGLMEGQLKVFPFGDEIHSRVKECYKEGVLIQDATFHLVHSLFAKYGLIVLIPDNAALKKQMDKVFEDDLVNQTPSSIVEKTADALHKAGYKQQANPRQVNLFYLSERIRGRIEKVNDKFFIHDLRKKIEEKELLAELHSHPERFSPNVILRGLYQETVLPNIAYIGGGGEIAYWLQYKDMFENYKTSFPVLLLRNSFLIVEKKWQEKIKKLDFSSIDFFQPETNLLNKMVERETLNKIKLNGVFEETEKFYEQLKKQAIPIDASLAKHIDALKTQSIHRLQELEKKMLRAEKRKFADQQRQIHTIKEKLFPQKSLQERIDNFMPYYAKWGINFIDKLYEYSLSMEHEFVVVEEK